MRLDGEGVETARFARLVRPSRSIPAEATAVHGIDDRDVALAPSFLALAHELLGLLEGAVFVAHNVPFDLGMLQREFLRAGFNYRPAKTACTLDAFRLLEPLAHDHRLESLCERHHVSLEDAHDAMNDALATARLLRVVLDLDIAPETVELDHEAFLRLRSRGDTRPASNGQIRRVFGLARSAGLVVPGGDVDRSRVVELVHRVSGTADIESLNREQVQDVYEALEQLIAVVPDTRAA